MDGMTELMRQVRDLQRRVAELERQQERVPAVIFNANGSVTMGEFSTEALVWADAGSVAATEQDWIEVTVGGNTGYVRVYASK